MEVIYQYHCRDCNSPKQLCIGMAGDKRTLFLLCNECGKINSYDIPTTELKDFPEAIPNKEIDRSYLG